MDIREVQAALLSLGYDPGPADGLLGLKTRAALVAFQRAAGLYPDGIAGPKTWLALQVGRPAAPVPAPARQSASTGVMGVP
ncbi:peptidoglycan-binding protein [Bosea sp. BIWAKO-01]|uniref:peptidoglycan-binding domain-containing protein n=1 Tax=Bosea sp. BIWAKO-01 TaxID=506668 RepID=UPI000853CF56|nr:peptidoglycan-binding domain-containing protein [Bosea sp. BIWAKO-01]GAU80565.1 LysM-repeat proteins and domains [Bosea sp. BIWAKO-01]